MKGQQYEELYAGGWAEVKASSPAHERFIKYLHEILARVSLFLGMGEKSGLQAVSLYRLSIPPAYMYRINKERRRIKKQ